MEGWGTGGYVAHSLLIEPVHVMEEPWWEVVRNRIQVRELPSAVAGGYPGRVACKGGEWIGVDWRKQRSEK